MKKYAIALHGGAGNLSKQVIHEAKEQAVIEAMEFALAKGEDILKKDGHAVDAVEAVVVELENHPFFNAGKGSVINAVGKHEMDAAIMDGTTLKAGAIASVHGIKNPIKLARSVMSNTGHVLLIGDGAIEFAKANGVEMEPEEYFMDAFRYNQWKQLQGKTGTQLDHTFTDNKFGTVGCVALDKQGSLAAATSTGGMTNKMPGRVGDSPIIGAGTYANSKTCAVSCTGHGEHFIRQVVAYDIHCLMEYKLLGLQDACNAVINQKLVSLGAEGGLIAVDAAGNITMPFNTSGMYRAFADSNGERGAFVF